MLKSGVYILTCKICNASYVGQTGRNFKIRLGDHERSWRLGQDVSSFSNHLRMHQVSDFISNVDFKILHLNNKGRKLDALENLEIKRLMYNNCNLVLNEQIDLNNSPLVKPFKNYL